MKITRHISIPIICFLVFCAVTGAARAYTVTLIYYNSRPLADEIGVMPALEDGDIIHLIFTNDEIRHPPNITNGMPTGDDVLWEWTSIGTGVGPSGTGRFLDVFRYDSAYLTKYVYIRFFNASVMGQVTHYGMSPLHTLTSFFRLDIWDVTAGGLYLWTEYPFIVIPEPETWLTMLPALLFAVFIFRKKRKEKKTKIS